MRHFPWHSKADFPSFQDPVFNDCQQCCLEVTEISISGTAAQTFYSSTMQCCICLSYLIKSESKVLVLWLQFSLFLQQKNKVVKHSSLLPSSQAILPGKIKDYKTDMDIHRSIYVSAAKDQLGRQCLA